MTDADTEAQITDAWRQYVEACLAHDEGTGRLCMARIDALLERIPRPREGDT